MADQWESAAARRDGSGLGCQGQGGHRTGKVIAGHRWCPTPLAPVLLHTPSCVTLPWGALWPRCFLALRGQDSWGLIKWYQVLTREEHHTALHLFLWDFTPLDPAGTSSLMEKWLSIKKWKATGRRNAVRTWTCCTKLPSKQAEGPVEQCGVNRPNKVADYVSVQEPQEPKRSQILLLLFPWISGQTSKHMSVGGRSSKAAQRGFSPSFFDHWRRGGLIAAEIKPSEKESLWREQMASDNERRTNRGKPSGYESHTVERLKVMRKNSGLCLEV